MNFRHAQRRSEVKFFGSPCNSSTSECSFEMKIDVVIPLFLDMISRTCQKSFSSRMLVL